MPRYLFTYRDGATLPADHVQRIRALGKIVDRDVHTLLVETDASQIPKLTKELPGWGIEPEQFYPVPDTRKKIQKPPADS
jgi:hypothetical protein